jgi:Protein of unknown function (DUF2939)
MSILRRSPSLFADGVDQPRSLAKVGKRIALAGIVTFAVVYVSAPYLAIWRLANALRQGDNAALETNIDWDAVREGLREDIADGITGAGDSDGTAPDVQAQSNELPPFGASFVKGIAGDVVNREVIPQHLSLMFQKMQDGRGSIASFIMHDVQYAFFDSLDSFRITVHCPGQTLETGPVQVELALEGYTWKVVRVRVPGSIAGLASKRT